MGQLIFMSGCFGMEEDVKRHLDELGKKYREDSSERGKLAFDIAGFHALIMADLTSFIATCGKVSKRFRDKAIIGTIEGVLIPHTDTLDEALNLLEEARLKIIEMDKEVRMKK